MTNEFDELASAHLDGRLTDEEAARVADDPSIQAIADEFGLVAEELARPVSPPDPELRGRQIGRALDVFDQLDLGGTQATSADATAVAPAPGPDASDADSATDDSHDDDRQGDGAVVDLRDRRRTTSTRPVADRPGGLPAWLGVAAALLVVVGGIGFFTSSQGSDSDDAADSETAAVEADSDGDDAGAGSADVAESTADREFDASAADESGADSATAGEAAETADDAADAAAPADGESDDAEEADEVSTTTDSSNALVAGSRVAFDVAPTEDEIADLVAGELLDPELAACATTAELPDGAEIVGFVPISVGDEAGEVLAYETPDDPLLRGLAVDSECEPLG